MSRVDSICNLIVVSMLVMSFFIVFSGESADVGELDENEIEDLTTLDIDKPENFYVNRSGNDIVLEWSEISNVDEYCVYWSDNKTAEFPEGWNRVECADNSWTHAGVRDDGTNYFYMVRGLNGSIEGQLSNVGFKVEIELKHVKTSKKTSWNWISLPYTKYDFNGDGEYTASDLVQDIEGGTGVHDNDYINKISAYDSKNDSYDPQFNYTPTGWVGEDFVIEIGDSISLNCTENYTWSLSGVEKEKNVDVPYPVDRYHWISIPYTFADNNFDFKQSTFDIVLDIENNLSSSEYIESIMDWGTKSQGYLNQTTFDGFTNSWVGDFSFTPGDGIGFYPRQNFSWTPTLMDLQPPTLKSVTPLIDHFPIDENITLEFSKEVNKTSFNNSLNVDDFNYTHHWENNRTLIIIPEKNLEADTDYQIAIEYTAKDRHRNQLDGNGDGITSKDGSDDLIIEIHTEVGPEIKHVEEGRVHFEDPFNVLVNVTDDVEMGTVQLNYSDIDGVSHNVSMDHLDGTDNFTYDITPQGKEGIIEYHFWAVDDNGIGNRSEMYSVPLLNLSAPVLMGVDDIDDLLELDGYINLSFTKEMNVTATTDAFDIEPYVHFLCNWSSKRNLTIQLINSDHSQRYELFLNVSRAKDMYNISLDGDGLISLHEFNTESPPEIEDVMGEQEIFKNENISLSASVSDDISLESVFINYIDVNGEFHNESAEFVDNNWTVDLPRMNHSGIFQYYFTAVDESGLWTSSDNKTINIENPLDIELANVSGTIGKSFDFEVDVDSPVGVKRVVLHYNGGLTKEMMLTEGDPGHGTWTCKVKSNQDTFEYQLEVIDMDDESAVLPQSPQSVELKESESSTFDWMYIVLIAICMGAALGGTYIWKNKSSGEPVEVVSKEPVKDEEVTQEEEQVKKDVCTICFGPLEEDETECSGCGNTFHSSCLYELGECPICGTDPLENGVENGQEEREL